MRADNPPPAAKEPGAGETSVAAGGLPPRCPSCGKAVDASMNFCRNCGTGLRSQARARGASATPPPVGAGALKPIRQVSAPAAAVAPQGSAPSRPQVAPAADRSGLERAPSDPVLSSVPQLRCQHCGAQTPSGFRFCQQCGKPLASGESKPALAAQVEHAAGVIGSSEGSAAGSLPARSASSGAPPVPAVAPVPAPAPVGRSAPVAEPSPWAVLVSVNRDGSEGAKHPITSDFLEIGRTRGLAFPDRYLGDPHARIDREADGARVVALEALNGVFVRIQTEADLADGDEILVGRELLRFTRVKRGENDVRELMQRGVARFGSPIRSAWGRLEELLPSGAGRDIRHLSAPEVVIGREDGDVVFEDDEFMSRRHAALRLIGDRTVLVDLGSSNGTFIRVRDSEKLSHGDHLRMGDQMFRFEVVGS